MENKSLFSAIVFALALVAGYFFYTDKITQLESDLQTTTQEYNNKLDALQTGQALQANQTNQALQANQASLVVEKSSKLSALESLNSQLIEAQTALKKSQDKLSLVTSKTYVLDDEITQMNDARDNVKTLNLEMNVTKSNLKTLEKSLQSAKKDLGLSTEKINYLENVFTAQNTQRVAKNIARIKSLKGTSSIIAVTGLVIPAIGVATLAAYTIEEIDNYCANIKDTIELENKVFGKIVSLDEAMQKSYHNQCVNSLKNKIKKGLSALK
ncbi:hypothetical protein [Candidatus Thioglobus sp.]|uniref:hypothetical protein n=1 Tax=Candidatus Thioglobus sp. TaxID=2026721 RepID=UPI003D133EBB